MMSTNWFDRVSLSIDENKRKVQVVLYAITCSGLIYALKSVRPFKKFQNASEIPKTFIDRRIKLNGNVADVDYKSTALLVDHNPIFNLHLRKKGTPGIAVLISGVNITSKGLAWLERELLEKCIHFTLLKKCDNQVSCIVFLKRNNIAEELIKLGFATVDVMDFDLENDKLYAKYYQRLLSLEEKAEKKNVGIWANSQPNFSSSFRKNVVNIFYELYYRNKK